jgi:hypothetical protein
MKTQQQLLRAMRVLYVDESTESIFPMLNFKLLDPFFLACLGFNTYLVSLNEHPPQCPSPSPATSSARRPLTIHLPKAFL